MSNKDQGKPRKARAKGQRKYPQSEGGSLDVLVLCVARGMTVREAAAEAGVSEPTAYRRSREPDFEGRVEDVRRGYLMGATGKLTERSEAMVGVIVGIATSAEESSAMRLKAATAALEAGSRLRAELETGRRLKRIEEALGISTGQGLVAPPDQIEAAAQAAERIGEGREEVQEGGGDADAGGD